MGKPYTVTLEFARTESGGEEFVRPRSSETYLLRAPDGTYKEATLPWGELLRDLAELRGRLHDTDLLVRLGKRLRAFLELTAWPQHAAAIKEKLDNESDGEVLVTLRSAAAELYYLPWELLLLPDDSLLGTRGGALIRHEYPGTEPRPARVLERDRVVFAWSDAVDDVKHEQHLEHLRALFTAERREFTEVAHASGEDIRAALERARASDKPASVLHILCHGAPKGGLGLRAPAAKPGERSPHVYDGPELARLLRPYADTLRLVVLSACESGDMGEFGNHLGSVALALHRAGIAAVISARYPLSIAASITFARSLYESLLRDVSSLEKAFRTARERCAALHPDTRDDLGFQLWACAAAGNDTHPIVRRPYRGLEVSEARHQHLFFGRDDEVEEGVREVLLNKPGLPIAGISQYHESDGDYPPIRPNQRPVGHRWPIQIDAYQDFLREKASKVLRGIGMPVSTMYDHRASQYGELFLIGVHPDERARVKQEVEKIGVKVHFADDWGAMEEIVEMIRRRFSLEPEEVDVFCAQFSSMKAHEIATYLGLSHERTARHIRRLCYAFQVEHSDEIPNKAINTGY